MGIDWKGEIERVESAEAAEPETKALKDSESEADNATDRKVGGTGEEASLGASGSSGAEWSAQGTQVGTARINFKLKRERFKFPNSRCYGL